MNLIINKECVKYYTSRIIAIIPDVKFFRRQYIKLCYMFKMKKILDFNNLCTLNEKIQYLKLNSFDIKFTTATDKVAAHDYIANKVGSDHLIHQYYSSNDIDSITLENIPLEDFIFKVNHDCSGGLVVRGIDAEVYNVKGVDAFLAPAAPSKVANIEYLKSFASRRFKYNHYFLSSESQYKNITPKFLFERLLKNSDGTLPNDYKLHCFNGKVEFIYVSADREGLNYRKIYYSNWSEAPFTWTVLGKEDKFIGPEVNKPKELDLMIKVAEKLSEDFQYIRVDLYVVDGNVYVGELTQHQGSGYEPILPYEYDLYYGGLINLDRHN